MSRPSTRLRALAAGLSILVLAGCSGGGDAAPVTPNRVNLDDAVALANNVCTAAHDDQVAFQQRISRDFSAPNPARDAVREFVINDVIPVVEGRVAALHGVIANTDRVTWDKAVKDLDQRLSDFKASVEPSQPADLLKATAAPLGTHPGAMLTAYGAKECKNW